MVAKVPEFESKTNAWSPFKLNPPIVPKVEITGTSFDFPTLGKSTVYSAFCALKYS